VHAAGLPQDEDIRAKTGKYMTAHGAVKVGQASNPQAENLGSGGKRKKVFEIEDDEKSPSKKKLKSKGEMRSDHISLLSDDEEEEVGRNKGKKLDKGKGELIEPPISQHAEEYTPQPGSKRGRASEDEEKPGRTSPKRTKMAPNISSTTTDSNRRVEGEAMDKIVGSSTRRILTPTTRMADGSSSGAPASQVALKPANEGKPAGTTPRGRDGAPAGTRNNLLNSSRSQATGKPVSTKLKAKSSTASQSVVRLSAETRKRLRREAEEEVRVHAQELRDWNSPADDYGFNLNLDDEMKTWSMECFIADRKEELSFESDESSALDGIWTEFGVSFR
jgi:hypothetical protein